MARTETYKFFKYKISHKFRHVLQITPKNVLSFSRNCIFIWVHYYCCSLYTVQSTQQFVWNAIPWWQNTGNTYTSSDL